jgi:hypothetical protein
VSSFEILGHKLRFLRDFYEKTTLPFREIQRKIDASEPPYVPRRPLEDYTEPPFLTDWLEANEGLRLQEQLCLTLLQRSFKEFLDATMHQHPDFEKNRPTNRGNWFERDKKWFLGVLNIDWKQAGVSLSRLEELTLARNSIQHGRGGRFDYYAILKRQNKDYYSRFPDAFFVDELEKNIRKESNFPQPITIDLKPEKMDAAISDIVTLCKFIDERLPDGIS